VVEPFFSTKGQGEGTGLGLSIVYAIVTRSRGHMEINSTVGEGTTFRIDLPTCTSPQTPERVGSAHVGETRGGQESILIVEDESNLRALAARLLEELGYEVITAPGGSEALMAFENRPRPFDVLLTDVVMPGMSGTELARIVRERHPQTGVILMSGYVGDACDIGDEKVPLLRKPFTRLARIPHEDPVNETPFVA